MRKRPARELADFVRFSAYRAIWTGRAVTQSGVRASSAILGRASCRQMMQLSDPTRFLKKRRPSYWVHPDSPRYSATSDSTSFDSTVNCR